MKNHKKKSEYLIFCDLLRNIRKEKDVTQSYLANILDKPQSYVSKYESGERRLDFVEVRNICNALGISLLNFTHRFENLSLTKKN